MLSPQSGKHTFPWFLISTSWLSLPPFHVAGQISDSLHHLGCRGKNIKLLSSGLLWGSGVSVFHLLNASLSLAFPLLFSTLVFKESQEEWRECLVHFGPMDSSKLCLVAFILI